MQLVSWCEIVARLQKAWQTWTAVYFFVARQWSKVVAGRAGSVISRSRGVRMPHDVGMARTLEVLAGGRADLGRSQGLGKRGRREACLRSRMRW